MFPDCAWILCLGQFLLLIKIKQPFASFCLVKESLWKWFFTVHKWKRNIWKVWGRIKHLYSNTNRKQHYKLLLKNSLNCLFVFYFERGGSMDSISMFSVKLLSTLWIFTSFPFLYIQLFLHFLIFCHSSV